MSLSGKIDDVHVSVEKNCGHYTPKTVYTDPFGAIVRAVHSGDTTRDRKAAYEQAERIARDHLTDVV